MSEENKYRKFICFVVGVIFLAVVAYALFSGQLIENLKVPGGEVKFGVKPEDQRINVIGSYDIGQGTVQGETTIYIDGHRVASLYADSNRPAATATVTVPKPNQYSYRLEETEISYVYDSDSSQRRLQKFTRTAEGKIEIRAGDGFKVGHNIDLHGQGIPADTKLTLRRISTKEEQDAEEKKQKEEIEKLLKE